MTMAACYANYDVVALGTHGIQQHHNNTQQLYSQQQQPHYSHQHQHHQQQHQNHYNGHHQQHTSNCSATVMVASTTPHNAVGNSLNVNIVNAVGISTQSTTSNQQHNTGSLINNSNNNNTSTSNQNASVSALTPASNVTQNITPVVSCNASTSSKDYTIPLHVDCSVEYELPNQPKPPIGQRVEPLLMIHPCYFRKMESQRRSPFVNNMPAAATTRSTAVTSLVGTGGQTSVNTTLVNTQNSLATSAVKRIRQQQSQVIQQHQQQQLQRQTVVAAVTTQQYQQQQLHTQQHLRHAQQQSQQQQQMSQMSQQAHYPVVVSHQQQQHHQHSLSQSGNSTDSATVAVASTYVDQQTNLVIRRNGNHRIARNQQQPHSIQSQRFLSHQVNSQWDQLTVPRSNITPIHIINTYNQGSNQNSGANRSTSDTNTITKKVINMVGKRDAMISGGTTYPKASSSTNGSKHNQHHSVASMATIGSIWNAATSHEVSTVTSSTVDMPTSTRNPNTVSIRLSMNRSPMAAVPSNYQADPDTRLVQKQSAININATARNHDNFNHQNYHNQIHDHQQQHHTSNNSSNNETNSSSNSNISNSFNTHYGDVNGSLHNLQQQSQQQQQQQQQYPDKLCGKYRQYFKAQRVHPYVTAATAASNLEQTFPQFTAAAVTAATPSFQHLQQISCYNV